MYHSTDFLLSSRDRSQIRVHRSVGGVSIKCIASNIRRLNLPWDSYQIIPGPGKEGNLVVVEALTSVGFRTEVEDQSGVDIPIRKGDRFVAVLANRHSGTSESGDIPPKAFAKVPNFIYSQLAVLSALNQALLPVTRNQWSLSVLDWLPIKTGSLSTL